MRFKATKQELVSRVVSTRTTCDVCGENINNLGYDASEVTIEARLGELYPENDHRKVHEVDICKRCFVEKAKPAIEALGCTFRVRNIDDDDRVDEAAKA